MESAIKGLLKAHVQEMIGEIQTSTEEKINKFKGALIKETQTLYKNKAKKLQAKITAAVRTFTGTARSHARIHMRAPTRRRQRPCARSYTSAHKVCAHTNKHTQTHKHTERKTKKESALLRLAAAFQLISKDTQKDIAAAIQLPGDLNVTPKSNGSARPRKKNHKKKHKSIVGKGEIQIGSESDDSSSSEGSSSDESASGDEFEVVPEKYQTFNTDDMSDFTEKVYKTPLSEAPAAVKEAMGYLTQAVEKGALKCATYNFEDIAKEVKIYMQVHKKILHTDFLKRTFQEVSDGKYAYTQFAYFPLRLVFTKKARKADRRIFFLISKPESENDASDKEEEEPEEEEEEPEEEDSEDEGVSNNTAPSTPNNRKTNNGLETPPQNICEVCGKVHDGSFGSGRFCCKTCSASFSRKGSTKRKAGRAQLTSRKKNKPTAAPTGGPE